MWLFLSDLRDANLLVVNIRSSLDYSFASIQVIFNIFIYGHTIESKEYF